MSPLLDAPWATSIHTRRWSELGNGKNAHEWEERISVPGPEDTGVHGPQIPPREYVVCSEVARRGIREARGVEGRITSVRGVRATLECCLLNRAFATRG
jgi:hypothetical protein